MVFDSFKKRVEKIKKGHLVLIHNEELKKKVDFVLFQLPPGMIKGMEIIEEIFDIEKLPEQVVVNELMDFIEIRKEIGRFILKHKRWKEQEDIAKKLLANEKINIKICANVLGTKDYEVIYENIASDIFAIYYGNAILSIDEIAKIINGRYMKAFTDRNLSAQYNIDNFIQEIFKKEKQKKGE